MHPRRPRGWIVWALAALGSLIAGTAPAEEGEEPPPAPAKGRLESKVMLRGYCHGDSEEWEGLGGNARSKNRPSPLPEAERGKHQGVALVLRLEDTAEFAGTAGFQLWLVNGTQEKQGFRASDGRLPIVQEARDREGKWRPIEYLPSSFCGNSYHTVFLQPGERWVFAAPRYQGPFPTRLRFRLDRGRDQPPLYSAEFEGSIHESQLTDKQGHAPQNLMDPYDD
jgi:hypothetical protein